MAIILHEERMRQEPGKRVERRQDALERARILRRLRRSLRERFFFHFSRIYEANRQHRVRQRGRARRGGATRQGTYSARVRASRRRRRRGCDDDEHTDDEHTDDEHTDDEGHGVDGDKNGRGNRAHLLVVWGEKVSGGDQQTGDGRSI
ncbi:hypothetical protein EXIGLDRAFT_76249 [Exidia glandulosa HHB12029]|uniref:Uncharacterized protein n=1 Tax=Exidia glandulosa HHB12029 TaxID=1314781 RepID=A0A165HQN6_EXIGL|nr:hypothetical protein EXIGLDRAFT_76249 [Exidia glandulosa HHB12029]